MDRDTKFTHEFREILQSAGVAPGGGPIVGRKVWRQTCSRESVRQISQSEIAR